MDGFVLVHTEVGRTPEIVGAVRAVTGVVKAEAVTGPYDVIAHVEASTERDLESRMVAEIERIPGVIRAMACPITTYHLRLALAAS